MLNAAPTMSVILKIIIVTAAFRNTPGISGLVDAKYEHYYTISLFTIMQ